MLRTTFFYFSDVALPSGCFHSASNKLQFQIQLCIIWLWSIAPEVCSLVPDSIGYFHSDVFQHPGLLVTAAKMQPLVHSSIMACCTCLFGREVVGPQFQKSMGKRQAVVEERITRAVLYIPSLKWAESRMKGLFSCKHRYILMDRCLRGWSLEGRTNSWEEQQIREPLIGSRIISIKETFLSWTFLLEEGTLVTTILLAFRIPMSQWLLCDSHSFLFFWVGVSIVFILSLSHCCMLGNGWGG